MRRALSVLATATAAAVVTTDPVSAFAFNVRAAANIAVAVAEHRLPPRSGSSFSSFVRNAAPQPRTRCRRSAAAAAAGTVGGTRMAVLGSDHQSPSGSRGASGLGEECRRQRVFDPRGARRRRTVAGAAAAKGKGTADGDRVWNTCKERVELGTSGLMVSRIGFGGIMIGGQMGEGQTHTVLDHAFDKAGINWLDTSESYPHPLIPDHKHKADPIVGSWLKKRDRSEVILCTKVAGRHEHVNWLRKDGSHTCLSRDHILESVYGSLERMDTEYIDMLYLGDWPDRMIQNYGSYYYVTSKEHELALEIEEQLMVVQELKDQGLVRHVACANETPFGVTKFCEHAIWDDLPKVACVQQEYNILTQNRVEMDLVEACAPRQENVAIIATTPFGGGAFSKKYMYDRSVYDRDPNYRLNMFPGFQGRYNSPRVRKLILEYEAIAARYNLTFQQMALAFVHNKPFITATLMGATNVEQIDQNVATLDITLPDDCLADIISVQDRLLEPMLGPSEVILKTDTYLDGAREFGGLTDETADYWERVTEPYTGP